VTKTALYFLALIPPEPISSEINRLKEEVARKYNSKAALRSPPHITLYMPFRETSKRISRLQSILTSFSSKKKACKITLDGFGSFPPKVIFVGVTPEPRLNELQKDLCSTMAQQMNLHNANYKDKPFHPHVTIAFRDLKKNQYQEAWEYYRNQVFREEFYANELALLRHNGSIWQIYERFTLLQS